jgi:hypothetical protein
VDAVCAVKAGNQPHFNTSGVFMAFGYRNTILYCRDGPTPVALSGGSELPSKFAHPDWLSVREKLVYFCADFGAAGIRFMEAGSS